LALLLLVPMLVGATVLGGKVGEVLGNDGLAIGEVEAQPAIAPLALPRSRPLNTDHQHAKVPITVPLTSAYTMNDASMRTVVGKASTHARYYEPKSHISPRVRWELARLKELAAQRRSQVIVLPNRGLKPLRLAAIDSVFQPSSLKSSSRDVGSDYWEIERFYVELTPGGRSIPSSPAPVPEPGTGSMLCLGLTWIAGMRRASRLKARSASQ
jgi:hypothetical protein